MPPWALSDEALVDTSQGCVPVAVSSRALEEGDELVLWRPSGTAAPAAAPKKARTWEAGALAS
eukprot:12857096-Alexandrium_andersonii.AAC.1